MRDGIEFLPISLFLQAPRTSSRTRHNYSIAISLLQRLNLASSGGVPLLRPGALGYLVVKQRLGSDRKHCLSAE
jgi:hypothetical protein